VGTVFSSAMGEILLFLCTGGGEVLRKLADEGA